MGILKKLFGNKKKTDAELKAELLKKATDHWNANSQSLEPDSTAKKNMPVYESNDKAKKKNIRIILLEIAKRGDAGILQISISDNTGVSQIDAASALAYLTKNNYVEAINSPSGIKYYLTDVGRKFCISKKFNSDF